MRVLRWWGGSWRLASATLLQALLVAFIWGAPVGLAEQVSPEEVASAEGECSATAVKEAGKMSREGEVAPVVDREEPQEEPQPRVIHATQRCIGSWGVYDRYGDDCTGAKLDPCC